METLDDTSSLLLPSPTQSRIPSSSSSSPPPPPPPTYPGLDLFTATELAAAEQLVQLSESSGDSAFWRTLSTSSFSSYSSSPRSVNTRPAPAVMIAEDDEDEDEDEIAGAPRRRRRRIRLIDDVYKATAPIALAARRGGMESSVGGRGGRAGHSKCRRKFGTGF